MSMLKSYFKGWQFRSARPSLEPGVVVNVFVNDYDENEGVGIAKIGDTKLFIEGAQPEYHELKVAVEITEFDEDTSTGRGIFQEVVGESSYTA